MPRWNLPLFASRPSLTWISPSRPRSGSTASRERSSPWGRADKLEACIERASRRGRLHRLWRLVRARPPAPPESDPGCPLATEGVHHTTLRRAPAWLHSCSSIEPGATCTWPPFARARSAHALHARAPTHRATTLSSMTT